LDDIAGSTRESRTPGEGRAAGSRSSNSVNNLYQWIRSAILNGKIKAGEQVNQAQLAVQFGVSRTPLREALRMLQREGLIISEPDRPVQISPLSAEDFEQIYIMRVAIECTAIQVSVPRLSSGEIADLEGCLAQMLHYQRVDDPGGFRAPHRAFHDRLIAGAGARVRDPIAELADHSERYRQRFIASGGWDAVHGQHREILDAAAARDSDRAACQLAEHHAQTAALILDVLDASYEPDRLCAAIAALAPGAEHPLRRQAASIGSGSCAMRSSR
jgi:DNA-binding GntR family transcriptional regulator